MSKPKPTVTIARTLNEHHERHSAGFYAALGHGGRFFQARVRTRQLQVTPDFGQTWVDVPPGTVFGDYNGRALLTA